MVDLRDATINSPEPQVQGGDDEQAEQYRGDQAPQDDDGHRARNLLTRKVAEDHQGKEGQPRRQCSDQDRREPLPRSSQDELRTQWLTLVALKALIVLDLHNAVTYCYPEHRE